MKRPLVFTMAALLVFAPQIHAEDKAAKPKAKTPEEQKKIQSIREKVNLKEDEINGSSWELTLKSSSDPKAKPVQDTFTFQDKQMTSTGYSKRGFASSNYTVSVSPDPGTETAVWETMKTGKDGVVFLRGEWQKNSMQGRITEQLDGGKKINEYYFNTDTRKAIAKSSKKEEPESASAPVQEAVVETAADSSSNALVSRESESSVLPFTPGSTDEVGNKSS